MAHMVESMMYAGQTPWHGLGVPVPADLPSSEAIVVAGLDWTVTTAPLTANVGLLGEPVEGWRAVVRESDNKVLGVVGDRYTPIQNSAAFDFLDGVVKEGGALIHTAGALDGGRRVWALARLPGIIRVAGDDITEKYLLLVNAHDGSMALRMLFTPIRVVCANTLAIALRQGAVDGIAIRHTASATARIEEARRALGLASSYYDEFAKEAAWLASTPFDDRQMADLATTLLPTPDDGAPSTRLLNSRNSIVELFTEGQGHDGIRGTAWAALNAVAEWTDHYRPTRGPTDVARGEARLTSAWFGSGAAIKRMAHEALTQQWAA